MLRTTPLLLALWAAPAMAITSPRTGFVFDLAAGPELRFPTQFGGAAEADLGFFHGRYDDDFALGRAWGATIGVRRGFRAADPWLPVLAVRRSLDVIVAGGHAWLGGGPVFTDSGVHGYAEAGVGVRARLRPLGRFMAPILRIRGGAQFGDGVAGNIGISLGLEAMAPLKKAD